VRNWEVSLEIFLLSPHFFGGLHLTFYLYRYAARIVSKGQSKPCITDSCVIVVVFFSLLLNGRRHGFQSLKAMSFGTERMERVIEST
jgi:hypothetical protein